MKRITQQIFTVILLTAVLISSIPISAEAKIKYTANTVTISTFYGWSRTYPAYPTKAEADANPIVIEINESDFPVNVVICAGEGMGGNSKYRFKSYGIQNVYAAAIMSGVYATIDIEPYVYEPKQPSPEEIAAAAQEKATNDKLDQLLKELDLSFHSDKATPYSKELKAYLTGEWDGSVRQDTVDEPYAGYITHRQVQNRQYIWDGTDLYTGENTIKKVSIDYLGYLEIVPGPAHDQQFSFAVSRTNQVFEQWCLLDKIDSWELPAEAAAETITNICIVGKNSGDSNECQALVITLDVDEISHTYSLLPGGIVTKLT